MSEMPKEAGDHVIPPLRMDQTAAMLAQATMFAMAGLAGDDPLRRILFLAAFLQQLSTLVKDKDKLAGILRALLAELTREKPEP